MSDNQDIQEGIHRTVEKALGQAKLIETTDVWEFEGEREHDQARWSGSVLVFHLLDPPKGNCCLAFGWAVRGNQGPE